MSTGGIIEVAAACEKGSQLYPPRRVFEKQGLTAEGPLLQKRHELQWSKRGSDDNIATLLGLFLI
jgi:hypothetical protein